VENFNEIDYEEEKISKSDKPADTIAQVEASEVETTAITNAIETMSFNTLKEMNIDIP